MAALRAKPKADGQPRSETFALDTYKALVRPCDAAPGPRCLALRRIRLVAQRVLHGSHHLAFRRKRRSWAPLTVARPNNARKFLSRLLDTPGTLGAPRPMTISDNLSVRWRWMDDLRSDCSPHLSLTQWSWRRLSLPR